MRASVIVWALCLCACESTATVDDLCAVSCDCSSCSAEESDGCISQSNSTRDKAVAGGCTELIDDFITCLEGDSVCVDGELEAGGDEACKEESQALRDEGCGCFTLGGRPSNLVQCAE